jgi:hypothetical protein
MSRQWAPTARTVVLIALAAALVLPSTAAAQDGTGGESTPSINISAGQTSVRVDACGVSLSTSGSSVVVTSPTAPSSCPPPPPPPDPDGNCSEITVVVLCIGPTSTGEATVYVAVQNAEGSGVVVSVVGGPSG